MSLISWLKGKEKTETNWDLENIIFELCPQEAETYPELKTRFLEENLRVRYSKDCIPDIKKGKQQTLDLDTSNVPLYTEVYRACFNAIKKASKLFDHRIMGFALKIDWVAQDMFSESGADINLIGLKYRKNEDEWHFGLVGKKSAIKKYLENLSRKKTQPTDTQNPWIEELEQGYILHNVVYNGRVANIGWKKTLNQDCITQQKHLNNTKNSRIKIPSTVLYHTSCEMLFNMKDHPDEKQKELIEKMKHMFAKDFSVGKPYICTSSVVKYNITGEDILIHNQGYSDEQIIKVNIVGCDVNKLAELATGTKDIGKMIDVYHWLIGRKLAVNNYDISMNANGESVLTLGVDADVTKKIEITLIAGSHMRRYARGVIVEHA